MKSLILILGILVIVGCGKEVENTSPAHIPDLSNKAALITGKWCYRGNLNGLVYASGNDYRWCYVFRENNTRSLYLGEDSNPNYGSVDFDSAVVDKSTSYSIDGTTITLECTSLQYSFSWSCIYQAYPKGKVIFNGDGTITIQGTENVIGTNQANIIATNE